MSWVALLQDYLSDATRPAEAYHDGSAITARHGVYDHSATLNKELNKTRNNNHIPTFFVKKRDNVLGKQLRKASKEHFISQKNDMVLSNEDLDMVLKRLQDKATRKDGTEKISYEKYAEVGEGLPLKFREFFKPSIFLRFKHDDEGRIEVMPLFNFILRCASIQQERVCIAAYDHSGDGYLTEDDLESYLNELIPTFPQLDQMEQGFLAFYLCGATRKFYFFLDTQRTGKIMIKDIILSPILSEFFELQQQELDPGLLLSNWFSMYSSLKVYGQYVDLDVDRNGMLSCDELAQFAKGRYNRLIIERVFQECQTYSAEIDYKNYLDFVLAINDLHNPRSLSYFFKLLDLRGHGYLDDAVLTYFVKELASRIPAIPFIVKDFLNEVFDMANTKHERMITYQNLVSCGVGGSIISLLIDSQAFTANLNKD